MIAGAATLFVTVSRRRLTPFTGLLTRLMCLWPTDVPLAKGCQCCPSICASTVYARIRCPPLKSSPTATRSTTAPAGTVSSSCDALTKPPVAANGVA